MSFITIYRTMKVINVLHFLTDQSLLIVREFNLLLIVNSFLGIHFLGKMSQKSGSFYFLEYFFNKMSFSRSFSLHNLGAFFSPTVLQNISPKKTTQINWVTFKNVSYTVIIFSRNENCSLRRIWYNRSNSFWENKCHHSSRATGISKVW